MISFSFTDLQRFWWLKIVFYLGLLIFISFFLKKILRKIARRFPLDCWKGRIDTIFYLPSFLFLWICAICLITSLVAVHFRLPLIYEYSHSFFKTIVIFTLVWVFLRWKKEIEKDFIYFKQTKKKIDMPHVFMIGRLISIVVICIFSLIILQIWGLDIVPLIAFGGVGAAALGFAAKEVIANFFGGMMLWINRPFVLGDSISLPDRGGLEGIVEELGWYLTVIRDRDKRLAYLPNAIFSTIHVINISRMSHRRIQITVGIRKEDFAKLGELTQTLKEVFEKHLSVDAYLPINVIFSSFGMYSLELFVEIYTKQTRYEQYLLVKQEILCLLYKTIQQMGIQVPNPIMVIEK
ncbi:Mechanosensitive ion channel [Candidatus Rhabdochlamydia oedothoracis]|uniref:Mechanosensitive ion channel n=1 Tax=Candidatus Rhabdochlamydia oedothoracis TaxID=2720720 RepID=A0ABX8V8U0_9BACT|nr:MULTISPECIES: mechanosensitive ion channel family protein [Rhabdochlamydia]KAG6559179.1 Low conductance mechanosensitive channel YnaI [Candidatus Rhabdochlamydia sp. W815]MCL6756558.1 mechanosensitive ion channel family protein [Candidatus Rhabdochlamydia oedothoracis]QYF49450.1 Mechanosensitive ion channel [Candidatus Rhabdochlamydia oedothoracis]